MSQRLLHNASLLKYLSLTSTPTSLFPTDTHLNTITCPIPSCRAPVTSDWEVHLCSACPNILHTHLNTYGTDVRRDSKGIWRGRIKDEGIDWWVGVLMGQSGEGRGCRSFRQGRLAGKVRSGRRGERCVVHGGRVGREVKVVEKEVEVMKEVVKEVKAKREGKKGARVVRVVQQAPVVPYMSKPTQSCCHGCCHAATMPVQPTATMPYESFYPAADTYWPVDAISTSISSNSSTSDGSSKADSASSASSLSSSSRSKTSKKVPGSWMSGAKPAKKKKKEKEASEVYVPGG